MRADRKRQKKAFPTSRRQPWTVNRHPVSQSVVPQICDFVKKGQKGCFLFQSEATLNSDPYFGWKQTPGKIINISSISLLSISLFCGKCWCFSEQRLWHNREIYSHLQLTLWSDMHWSQQNFFICESSQLSINKSLNLNEPIGLIFATKLCWPIG